MPRMSKKQGEIKDRVRGVILFSKKKASNRENRKFRTKKEKKRGLGGNGGEGGGNGPEVVGI